MFSMPMLQLELQSFFTRKYRLAMLALASYISLC